MMTYIEMTVEEAVKFCKNNGKKTVLVAVQDLEKDDIAAFVKKRKEECEDIIRRGKTITQQRDEDDFMSAMKVYSVKQEDIMNIKSKGILSTILLKE